MKGVRFWLLDGPSDLKGLISDEVVDLRGA
jgi:hypothetical protein